MTIVSNVNQLYDGARLKVFCLGSWVDGTLYEIGSKSHWIFLADERKSLFHDGTGHQDYPLVDKVIPFEERKYRCWWIKKNELNYQMEFLIDIIDLEGDDENVI